LVWRDHWPIRVEFGLLRAIVIPAFPKLRLPYSETAPLRFAFTVVGLVVPSPSIFGQDDLLGIFQCVEQLMGGVSGGPVLLFALVARRPTLVVSGDFLAVLSRPFGHS
jgi:hypothetical protein